MSFRPAHFWCFLLLIAAMVLFPERAEALTVDARVGFNGFFQPGRWTPVIITIENLERADKAHQTIKDFDGTCVVRPGGFPLNVQQPVFSRILQVPRGDRKRIIIYATLADSEAELQVELRDKGGKKAAEIRVRPKPGSLHEPVVGYVDTLGAPLILPRIPEMPEIKIGAISAEDIPDQWYGYDSLSMLVVPRHMDKLFEGEKFTALQRWISQGGQALFVGGRYAQSYRGTAIESLLPGRVGETSVYHFEGSNMVPVAGTPAPADQKDNITLAQLQEDADSKVLFEIGGTPILTSRAYGSGAVLYLASDWPPPLPPQFPLARLLSSHLLTRRTLDGVSHRFNNDFLYRNQSIFQLGTANLLPNRLVILAILLSYLVIVGPLNFLILKKQRRLELAWVTIPAIVLAYSAGIYAVSSRIKGQDSYQRTFHLFTGRSGSSQLRAESLMLAFMPTPGQRSVSFDEAAAVQHVTWSSTNIHTGVGGKEVMTQQSASGMSLPYKFLRQWDTDFTRFDWVADLGQIETDLTCSGNKITGKVTNRTSVTLNNLGLLAGGHPAILSKGGVANTLGPGATMEVSVDLAQDRINSSDNLPASADSAAKLRDKQFYEAVVNPLEYDLPYFVLFAAIHDGLPSPKIESDIIHQSSYGFLALEVPVKRDAAAPLVVLSETGRLKQEVATTYMFGGYEHDRFLQLSDVPTFFDFTLPAPEVPDGLISELAFSPRDNFRSLECSVFDFYAGTWAPVTLKNMPVAAVPKELHDNNSGLANLSFPGVEGIVHPFNNSLLIRAQRNKSQLGASLSVTRPGITTAGITEQQ